MKWTTKGVNVIKNMGYQVIIPAPMDNNIAKLSPEIAYTIEIKKVGKKRSLNANAYCWVLCQKIACELSKEQYISDISVYRKAIMESKPRTEHIMLRDDGVDDFIKGWTNNHIGRMAIKEGPVIHNGKHYTVVRVYYGSSDLTVSEMSRLIEALRAECDALGIALEPPDYVKALLDDWGNAFEQAEERR